MSYQHNLRKQPFIQENGCSHISLCATTWRFFQKLLLFFGLLASCQTAHAISVPDATGYYNLCGGAIYGGGIYTNVPATAFNSRSANCAGGNAITVGTSSVALSSGPTPSVSANSSDVSTAQGILDYSFTILGPSLGPYGKVPVVMSGSMTLSAAGKNGQAGGELNLPGFGSINHFCSPFNGSIDCGTFGFSGVAMLFPNTVYLVEINAWTGAAAGGSGSSWVDPYLLIDPNFAGASNYSLVVSQGIGNSPVPVPAAVWLFGSGLLGLIGVAQRKLA